jgi:putative oxidoreductase
MAPRTLLARLCLFIERGAASFTWLQPAAQLAARWYVASVFFASGLTKLRDWDSTLALFSDEYQVPLLSPWVVNGVAVLSLMDIPDPALLGHVFWGSLLLALLLWGSGRWSLDRFLIPSLRAWVCDQRSEPAAPRLVPGRPARR